MRVDLIAGARPNFVKIAALTHAFAAHHEAGGRLRYRLVHTGQHYDPRLSADFFDQLGIPAPDVNLDVGSGSHAVQTAAIMTRYEELLLEGERPALTLVVGDVTSSMACAITAQKVHVPVAHVEGGIRSGDWRMPEEINRLVTDSITNWFYTTSTVANENLRASGVNANRIVFVGNTMIDTLLRQRSRLRPPSFWSDADCGDRPYLVLTLHRPSNVDDPAQLKALLDAISSSAGDWQVIFPVHPRTGAKIEALGAPAWPNIRLVEPQPYLEFNYLVAHATGVITDSGGITEEATVLGVPCMTLRDSTERPETVTEGTNELLGTDPAAIHPAIERLRDGHWKSGRIPMLWDGKAGERIVAHLESVLT